MIAEIFLAIKSITQLVNLFQNLILEVKSLRLAMEMKNLDELKAEVNEKIEQIKVAKTDADRLALIVAISKRMQK